MADFRCCGVTGPHTDPSAVSKQEIKVLAFFQENKCLRNKVLYRGCAPKASPLPVPTFFSSLYAT